MARNDHVTVDTIMRYEKDSLGRTIALKSAIHLVDLLIDLVSFTYTSGSIWPFSFIPIEPIRISLDQIPYISDRPVRI